MTAGHRDQSALSRGGGGGGMIWTVRSCQLGTHE